MKIVNLEWDILPAVLYEVLLSRMAAGGIFVPLQSPGVYLLIHWNGERYQIYYAGAAAGPVGDQLVRHYRKYAGEEKSDSWLPRSAELFNGDIHRLFRNNSGTDFVREGPDFPRGLRRSVGRAIMGKTYFAFAKVAPNSLDRLTVIEAVLHHGLLRKNYGEDYVRFMHGWFGEGKAKLPPDVDLTIRNTGPNAPVEKMIFSSLPRKIVLVKGQLSISRR
ncbi:MAG: hypothetical protein ACOX8W_03530 [bacterium]|jgi:hypothetical protein